VSPPLCFWLTTFRSWPVDRYALQLLTPASILANLAGRTQIEVEDVGEMNELFLDAKRSAALIGSEGGFDGGGRQR
jgi:RuvB-like protein 1 (pontin 52)